MQVHSYLKDHMDPFNNIRNPPPCHPSPPPSSPPPPTPPRNPPPPPPEIDEHAHLQAQINANVRTIQDQINIIQNEECVAPPVRMFASRMQTLVDVVRAMDGILDEHRQWLEERRTFNSENENTKK